MEANPELVLFTIRDISREEANAAIRDAGLSPHPQHPPRGAGWRRSPCWAPGKTDYRALKASLK